MPTYISTQMHTHTYLLTYTCKCIQTCAHTNTYTHMHICTRICIRTYRRAYMGTHTCILTFLHAYIHTQLLTEYKNQTRRLDRRWYLIPIKLRYYTKPSTWVHASNSPDEVESHGRQNRQKTHAISGVSNHYDDLALLDFEDEFSSRLHEVM